MVAHGEVCEAAAHLVNPPHRLAIGREHEDGAVVHDDLHVALVVLDDNLVVLDRVAHARIAVGAATPGLGGSTDSNAAENLRLDSSG